MQIRPVLESDIDQVMKWRWAKRDYLRTPYMVNDGMQKQWFKDIVSNRQCPFKFYMLFDDKLYGYAQLECQMENGFAELGIIVIDDDNLEGSFECMLDEAFNRLRMETVYIECYENNPALEEWKKITKDYKPYTFIFPRRKWVDGKLQASKCFIIKYEEWKKYSESIGIGLME